MKRIVYIFSLMALSMSLSAQSMEEANALYQNGEYQEAAAMYQSLIQIQPAAETYYNLGNAYFKQGELAQSILSYERALRIRPYYKDAKYNLRFAQSRIIDNIEDKDAFFLLEWVRQVRDLMSEQAWMWLSISTFLLTIISLFVFFFTRTVAMRKTGFYVAVIALVISLAGLGFAASLNSRDTRRSEAIVVQGIVNVKASPDRSGTDLFTLHEGTKVHIRSTLSEWAEITVGDNRGWMPIRMSM